MLFENTARVPLLIHDPAHPTRGHMMRTTELAELVDLYPTAAALAGLPPPPKVDGTDLSPLFAMAALDMRHGGKLQGGRASPPLKAAAFSQFPRCNTCDNTRNNSCPDNAVTHHVCFNTDDNAFPFMGFSIRCDRHTKNKTHTHTHKMIAPLDLCSTPGRPFFVYRACPRWPHSAGTQDTRIR